MWRNQNSSQVEFEGESSRKTSETRVAPSSTVSFFSVSFEMNPEPIAGVPDDRSLGYRRSEWQPDRRDVSRAEQRRDTVPISKAPLSLAARAVGPTNKAARRKSRPVVDDVIVFLSNRRRRRRRRRRSRTSPRPAICKFRMQMSRRGFVHDTFSMVSFPRSSVRSFFLGGGAFSLRVRRGRVGEQ